MILSVEHFCNFIALECSLLHARRVQRSTVSDLDATPNKLPMSVYCIMTSSKELATSIPCSAERWFTDHTPIVMRMDCSLQSCSLLPRLWRTGIVLGLPPSQPGNDTSFLVAREWGYSQDRNGSLFGVALVSGYCIVWLASFPVPHHFRLHKECGEPGIFFHMRDV